MMGMMLQMGVTFNFPSKLLFGRGLRFYTEMARNFFRAILLDCIRFSLCGLSLASHLELYVCITPSVFHVKRIAVVTDIQLAVPVLYPRPPDDIRPCKGCWYYPRVLKYICQNRLVNGG